MNVRPWYLHSLFLVYALVLIFNLYHHEMWRDELRAWALTNASQSIPDLFHRLNFEGHPSLWYVLLFPFSRVSANPVFLQVLNAAAALGVAWLLIYRSPFTFVEKLVFCFGYYTCYEYAVISRNYMIGFLLVLLICRGFLHWRRNLFWLSLALFLLFQCNFYAILIGIGLSAGLLMLIGQARLTFPKTTWIRIGLAVVIALVGLAFALWTLIPPSDGSSYPYDRWFLVGDLRRIRDAFSGVFSGLLPVPPRTLNFWNHSWFQNTTVMAVFGMLFVALLAWMFRKDRPVLLIFLISFLLIFTFFYSKSIAQSRHLGHYFIVSLACYWLFRQNNSRTRPAWGVFPVAALVSLHLPGALWASYVDARSPFSNTQRTVNFIQANFPAGTPLAGELDGLVAALSSSLNQEIHFLNNGKTGYYNFNNLSYYPPPGVAMSRLIALVDSAPKRRVVLAAASRWPQDTAYELPAVGQARLVYSSGRRYQIRCLAFFGGAIEEWENYYVYDCREL
ncbi:MAG: hypothetical protein LH606_15990 [Cytophagaceae bacterium]|nr:hypothetical protein [Cytophagaceae bacterium]